jgi:hypothetical protein
LTIDCDDIRHVPKNQGHPTRSKSRNLIPSEELSRQFIAGMNGFECWMDKHGFPITLFVIADMFESKPFSKWLGKILSKYKDRITIGCHGLTHRSWSAWPEDSEGFFQSLSQAKGIIQQRVGDNWRPWFRAPGGYIAPWMADVIAECGFTVDTSINPSWLVKKKTGKGNNWKKVRQSIDDNKIIEREWLNKWSLPVNGPALSIFPLSIISKMAWNKLPPILTVKQALTAPEDIAFKISTVYWHILDHNRGDGNWKPPLPKHIFSQDNQQSNT